jgi:hypothetical protein
VGKGFGTLRVDQFQGEPHFFEMTRKIGRVIAEFSLFLDEFCKSVKYLRFSVIFEFTDVLFATGGISLNKLIKDDGYFSIMFF